MPQYAVLIYEKELPGGVADIPPDVMEANVAAGEKIAAMGVRVVHELALQPAAATDDPQGRPRHRRAVPRDQGGARRVLRGGGP